MPLDVTCPQCRYVFPVTEAQHPIEVPCPHCDAELIAEFRTVPPPVAPGQSPYELLVSRGRPTRSPPGRLRATPPCRPDVKPEPHRTGSSIAVVILAGIGALLVTLAGLTVTGYYLFANRERAGGQTDTPAPVNTKASRSGATIPGGSDATNLPASPGVRRPQR